MQIPDARILEALDPPSGEWRSRTDRRDAAVLAPLFEAGGEDHVLFTKRAADLEQHAGEISFPGGGREGDEDALACALRECREEIGLAPGAVRVLGRLPERGSIHGFHVHVFVGRIPPPDGLVLDPIEVDGLLTIPVAELMREERWEYRDVERGIRRWRVPFFEHDGDVLWGLTARLTLDLLERIG